MFQDRSLLLICEDQNLCSEFNEYFSAKAYQVKVIPDEQNWVQVLEKEGIDLIVLDVGVHTLNRKSLIQRIREHPVMNAIPILVLAEPDIAIERRQMILAGADEVLVKPVLYSDLEIRIIAYLRRAKTFMPMDQILNAKQIQVNLRTRLVLIEGRVIKLTKTEYKIFLDFFSKPGIILQREELVQRHLPNKNANSRTLDVHVNSLRKKLGNLSQHLKTIRGQGYIFDWEEADTL